MRPKTLVRAHWRDAHQQKIGAGTRPARAAPVETSAGQPSLRSPDNRAGRQEERRAPKRTRPCPIAPAAAKRRYGKGSAATDLKPAHSQKESNTGQQMLQSKRTPD